MKIPILIMGYERSGTTLLRRLVSMHPGLEYELVHERSKLLLAATGPNHARYTMTYPGTQQKQQTGSMMSIRAGQKIPYSTFSQAKKYIDKFRSLFPDSYLMHIIREPLETINSQIKTFKRNPTTCIKNYFSSVPLTYKYVIGQGNSCTICYENLVQNPKEVLAAIYAWMGPEDVSNYHLHRVLNTRDPWEGAKRVMPGLRYFDQIISKPRKIILNTSVVNKISLAKRAKYSFDF